MNDQRITSVDIRYYGEIAQDKTALVRNAILSGIFKPLLSPGITVVNAAGVAAERGIEVVESHSTRTRNYASLISVRLRSGQGERWVEGAVSEDGRGESMSSASFAGRLQAWRAQGKPAVAFVVGGDDGLAPSLRENASLGVAFGAATWPHQLVRVMLLEQLYRAVTILAGHPYHRG